MRILPLSLACLTLSTVVAAQEMAYESFTSNIWNHSGGGTWKNGVKETKSTFGKVDQLVSAAAFTYTRNPIVLEPGTYVAVARFAKITSAAGTAPIELRVISGSGISSQTTAATAQKIDSFLHTRALKFTVGKKAPVLIFLQNTDTKITKTNYLFDSFHLGKVPAGRAVLVESMGRRWGHAWGCPHYIKEFRDKTATFGFVEKLNARFSSVCGNGNANLWWFDWQSGQHTFLPGLHTFNLRIKKVNSLAGQHQFDLWIRKSTDGGATFTASSKVNWPANQHVLGKWVYSPNISFMVTNPKHIYRFKFSKTGGAGNSFKADYHFDTLTVRRGEFSPFGKSCMNGGQAQVSGLVPQLGHSFDIDVGPMGVSGAITMILGLKNPNFDLGTIGWTGCFQYATLDVLLPMSKKGGTASMRLPLPNDKGLIGVPFFAQAYTVNGKVINTTHGMRAQVGN